MAVIATRKFQFQDDKYLLLANEEWTRPLPFAGNWMRIRLGFLCAVSGNGTSNILDCPFFFGLCSGRTAPSSARSPQNFFGVSFNGLAAPGSTRTLTYTANGNLPYYTASLGEVFRQFGTTQVAASFNNQVVLAPAWTGTQKRRVPIFVDITRQSGGGGVYTVNVYGVNATTVAFDYRQDHLLDGVDQLGTPVINGQTMTVLASAVNSVNASEVAGQLDTICLYWGRSAFPLELYAVGASVITPMPYDAGATGADDTFESYSAGSIATGAGTISGGTGWAGAMTFAGTSNIVAQVGYSGTTLADYDNFNSYSTGTFIAQNAGTHWGGPYAFGGTYPNLAAQSGYAGTSAGMPFDTFETYGTTSGSLVPALNSTGFWAAAGTVIVAAGTSYWNPSAQTGYSGTSSGFPGDNFESYSVGPVISNVTIVGGTGWGGAAAIN